MPANPQSPMTFDKGVRLPAIAEASVRTNSLMMNLRRLAVKGEIGDSLYVQDRLPKDVVTRCAQVAGRGWYESRTEEAGTRVWKTAEPCNAGVASAKRFLDLLGE